jgi:hypothetical protein
MENGDSQSGGRLGVVISAAAPLLDLVLAVGDRVSKLLEPEDYEYYPVRDEDPQESEGSSRSRR